MEKRLILITLVLCGIMLFSNMPYSYAIDIFTVTTTDEPMKIFNLEGNGMVAVLEGESSGAGDYHYVGIYDLDDGSLVRRINITSAIGGVANVPNDIYCFSILCVVSENGAVDSVIIMNWFNGTIYNNAFSATAAGATSVDELMMRCDEGSIVNCTVWVVTVEGSSGFQILGIPPTRFGTWSDVAFTSFGLATDAYRDIDWTFNQFLYMVAISDDSANNLVIRNLSTATQKCLGTISGTLSRDLDIINGTKIFIASDNRIDVANFSCTITSSIVTSTELCGTTGDVWGVTVRGLKDLDEDSDTYGFVLGTTNPNELWAYCDETLVRPRVHNVRLDTNQTQYTLWERGTTNQGGNQIAWNEGRDAVATPVESIDRLKIFLVGAGGTSIPEGGFCVNVDFDPECEITYSDAPCLEDGSNEAICEDGIPDFTTPFGSISSGTNVPTIANNLFCGIPFGNQTYEACVTEDIQTNGNGLILMLLMGMFFAGILMLGAKKLGTSISDIHPAFWVFLALGVTGASFAFNWVSGEIFYGMLVVCAGIGVFIFRKFIPTGGG